MALPLDLRALQNLLSGIATLHSHVDAVVRKVSELNQRARLFAQSLETLSEIAGGLPPEIQPAPQKPKEIKIVESVECTEDDFL